MKIAAEIGWAQKHGGARQAAINILLEMARLCPKNRYTVYSNSAHPRLKTAGILQAELKAPPMVSRVLWDQFIFPHIALPLAVRKASPDVIYYTNNIVSYFGKIPAVVTIHDMTPFIMPESFVGWHGAYQRSYFRFAAKKAAKIITVSQNSKGDICRILKVPDEKVVVIPNAVDPAIKQKQPDGSFEHLKKKHGIDGPFILYVGAIHPRKNIRRLLAAYCQLKASNSLPHKLVIAGSMRWKSKKTIQFKGFDKIKADVIFTGAVSTGELSGLYENCEVFVYPSLYEGFGIPVLEAMAWSAPVVTSNTSALPEVAGEAAVLVDP
ncbi:MAG: glycosyltransferase family 4 protein, partial [Candidatus Omnitrophica bacterium]|nr:glycosyltransferase family 4 protein [Candidatus Omnitrophota bacterium]